MAEQELCMERLYAYNHTRPSEHAKREQLLCLILYNIDGFPILIP